MKDGGDPIGKGFFHLCSQVDVKFMHGGVNQLVYKYESFHVPIHTFFEKDLAGFADAQPVNGVPIIVFDDVSLGNPPPLALDDH
jgi:hypothetical protein